MWNDYLLHDKMRFIKFLLSMFIKSIKNKVESRKLYKKRQQRFVEHQQGISCKKFKLAT